MGMPPYMDSKKVDSKSDAAIRMEDVALMGHAQAITVRCYRPETSKVLPIVMYFHGGGFTSGNLDDAGEAALLIASLTPAWVVSVGYSLAPGFPYPTALEDALIATQWAVKSAKAWRADGARLGVAGHDAGGNLATCLSAVVRDRAKFKISAQALLAPLLDPSMTRVGNSCDLRTWDLKARECARSYRAYLPNALVRMHPYAAPIESRRLKGLPAAFIGTAYHDILRPEAEKYANELIAAGVPTEIDLCEDISHEALASHSLVLTHVSDFFGKRLAPHANTHGAHA